jgi:DNA-binding transcriptional MerR regulator
MHPSAILYTRQQIGELTGIASDTLNYWMREGVLRPAAGGDGRGSHRRLPYWEVNLAAILNQVQQFGAGLASLKALARLFHDAADWIVEQGLDIVDEPRLIFIIQENRADFDKWGHYPVGADEFPERQADSTSELTGKPRVHLSWPETVEWMKHGSFYGPELEAHFADRHFELAEQLPSPKVKQAWEALRRIVRVPAQRPTSAFPTYFHRPKDGPWAIAGTPAEAAKLGYSFIAVDEGALLYDLWHGRA